MKDRIQKILSSRGVASRRRAEEMILAGRVTCNGTICRLGDSADPDADVICLDGRQLPSKKEAIYLILNKPRGFVTTLSDEKGRKNAAQLVEACGERVYPVGRLDMDSEGLLIFTNDGDFANHLMHPKHEIDKCYRVSVKGFSADNAERLKCPIVIDGYKIKPPEVEVLSAQNDRGELLVTIHEGRNRQVRRMCAAAGMQVTRLVRVSEGGVMLGDLPSGKWRFLTQAEIGELSK